LEAGVDPCDYYDNTKRVFREYENWTPGNADETYGGSYSLTGSLTHSINSVAIQVLEDAGIPHTIDVARRVGIESDIPAVPSIALGTSDVRLDELTRAYCSFVNGGKNIDPVCILKITDRYGNIIYEHGPPMSIVSSVSDTIAITVLNMLEMVVNAGTAGSLKPTFDLRIPLAGKTGTSQSHADGWFMGLTPTLVTGVWVGADDPRVHFKTLAAGQGSRTAMQIYGQFLSNALKDPSFEAWKESEFYPGTKDRIRYGDCPPFSYLTAAEMESFRDMTYPEEQQPQEVSGFESFVKSIFGPRPSSPADEERLVMEEMQRELDRAVTRMKKQGKTPTEIRRRLSEIRKEYYEKIQPDLNKEEI
jgi:penicillin-binding protein 1A